MPSSSTASDRKPTADGGAAPAVVWLCLAAAAAAAGLDAPLRASWKAIPLRDWAAAVATVAGMPVIVDRRLDPDTLVTLASDGGPLREAVATVAAGAGAEVAVLRSSIRIVPAAQRGLCERAEVARDREVARLPAGPRAALQRRSRWNWSEAAQPRELAATAAAAAGVVLEGLDELPHDHFPAAELPPLTVAEKLDLVLAHFDKRVVWRADAAGARGTVVPLATDLPPPGSVQPKRPPVAAGPGRGKPPGPARDVFSLRVAAPLEEVLAAVAARLGLELEIDRGSLAARGIQAGEIVRADIRDASRDDLLDRIVAPLDLSWRIEGDRLRVFATPPASQPE